ncbi:hypothetical protein DB347_12815 [Opitutaceae bacterium EW11]|nr:hypothetical protein DB347_12815 [Opitutaceae bacterium EW11]
MKAHPTSPWLVPVSVTATVTLVFGLLVGGLTLKLRSELHDEVLRREAEAIHAVAQMQLGAAELHLTDVGVQDPVQDLFAAVLESSRLRGVLAVRLYDEKGDLRDALPVLDETAPMPAWWIRFTRQNQPIARFHPEAPLESVYGLPVQTGSRRGNVPLLEVAVPLLASKGGQAPLGVAHYWIDGRAVADEFARTDRGLAWQAGAAFTVSSLLVVAVLAWAFSRLEKTNRQLRVQGADLARANQELSFAAKTAAVGAISSHLIHEIKNPLIGLEGFVRYQVGKPNDPAAAETWREAADATRRLRDMINQVVSILRDETYGGLDYRMSATEVVHTVHARLADLSAKTGVVFSDETPEGIELTARTANLACLILVNLVGNGMEAAPRGSMVRLNAGKDGQQVRFTVSDSGGGLPAAVLEFLFHPVTSSKQGGSGIGLAISHQLAQQAGGELQLVRSDPQGTEFVLTVPAAPAE